VIALASGTQVGPTTERGLLLIAAYRLGLGLPFILLALGARWAVDATVRPERASQAGKVMVGFPDAGCGPGRLRKLLAGT
jgi:cytochrome c biogenesis protein CcdA